MESTDSMFWGGLVIRILAGSAVGWAMGWDPANFLLACVG